MKKKMCSMILLTLWLGVSGATIVAAQNPATPATPATPAQSAKQKKEVTAHNQMMMMNEPNYVLATAYHQGLVSFAQALHGQSVGAMTVNVDFARAAVAEMRRDYDMMKKYNEEYMKTISAEVRENTAPMMQQFETHRAGLNAQLTALEKEVALDVPDTKKVATLTTAVQTHLDAMSKLDESNPMSKMTMDM